MPASKQFFFRPVEIKTTEISYPTIYKIEVKVHYFFDEAMTQFSHEKDMVFENVPFSTDWAGMLGDIYNLIGA